MSIIKKTILIVMLAITPMAYAHNSHDKLIFAIDLIRHGDRTPLEEIPKDPHHWAEGLGALTATGAEQEKQLGASRRKQYIDETHLLPEKFDPNTVYVRSTDIPRAIHSAEAFFSGLYPNEKITISSKHHDKMLLAEPSLNPIYLVAWAAKNLDYWNQQTAALQPELVDWREVTGFPLNNFRSLGRLADALYIRQLHHVGLPAGLTQRDANQIIQLASDAMVQEFKFKEMTEPMGNELIRFIVSQMQTATDEQNQLKYILLSAHDSTIMAVMNTLAVPMDHIPDYASHLTFALYQRENEYTVRINLNDKPVAIPVCGGDCSLNEFIVHSKT